MEPSIYLCIYHGNCADGFGAAWSMRRGVGEEWVEFYPGVHQQEPPDVTDRHVFLLDFSYKKEVLEEMAKSARTITIIDHHKSAADDLSEYINEQWMDGSPEWFQSQCIVLGIKNIRAEFDMERSGAMMAWNYFNPEQVAPRLIKHIQDRDLWQFKLEGTRQIQANVFSYPYDFEAWDILMAQPTAELLSDGCAIERKHFKDIYEFIGAAAYRMKIAGHDVPVLNAPYFWSSDAGEIMGKGEKFAACYWDTPKGRIFSLRSADDGLDVSAIATSFGGGGHEHAAGFSVPIGADVSEAKPPEAR